MSAANRSSGAIARSSRPGRGWARGRLVGTDFRRFTMRGSFGAFRLHVAGGPQFAVARLAVAVGEQRAERRLVDLLNRARLGGGVARANVDLHELRDVHALVGADETANAAARRWRELRQEDDEHRRVDGLAVAALAARFVGQRAAPRLHPRLRSPSTALIARRARSV